MFVVYDGHGGDGHHAASFAKKKLPQTLAKYVRQRRVKKYMTSLKAEGKSTKTAWNPEKWPFLEIDEFEQCCAKSFVETNQLMHLDKSVRTHSCVSHCVVAAMKIRLYLPCAALCMFQFDDGLCGTTAAAVVFHAGRMTICNVGDSRVLLGHRVQSQRAEPGHRHSRRGLCACRACRAGPKLGLPCP